MKNNKTVQSNKNLALLYKNQNWIPPHIWKKLSREQQNAHKAKVYEAKALRQQQQGVAVTTKTFSNWVDPTVWKTMTWEAKQQHHKKVAESRGEFYQIKKKPDTRKNLRPGFVPSWIEPHIWKKMSRAQQNEHKARIAYQAAIVAKEKKAKLQERRKFNIFFKKRLTPKLAHLFFHNYLDKVGKVLTRDFTPKLTQKLQFTSLPKRPSVPWLWKNHTKQKLQLIASNSVFRSNLKQPGALKALSTLKIGEHQVVSERTERKRLTANLKSKEPLEKRFYEKLYERLLLKRRYNYKPLRYSYLINIEKTFHLWKPKKSQSKRFDFKKPPIFFLHSLKLGRIGRFFYSYIRSYAKNWRRLSPRLNKIRLRLKKLQPQIKRLQQRQQWIITWRRFRKTRYYKNKKLYIYNCLAQSYYKLKTIQNKVVYNRGYRLWRATLRQFIFTFIKNPTTSRKNWVLKLSNKILSHLIVKKISHLNSRKQVSGAVPWWHHKTAAKKWNSNTATKRRSINRWRRFNVSLNDSHKFFKDSRKYLTLNVLRDTTYLVRRKIKNFYVKSSLTTPSLTTKKKARWLRRIKGNKNLKRYLGLQADYSRESTAYIARNQLPIENSLSLRSYPKPSLYDLDILSAYQKLTESEILANIKYIHKTTGWLWYVFIGHYKRLPFKKKKIKKKKKRVIRKNKKGEVIKIKVKTKVSLEETFQLEKQRYLFHFIWQRYRWVYNPRIKQFKTFKKFFKRSLKRFRRINKNRLFITKFRNYFAQLSGLSERGIFGIWRSLRRSHNEYSGLSSLVNKFSQTIQLMPLHLLVFLRITPSIAASRFILKSGSVYVNGLAATGDTRMKPGDIMQLNNNSIKQIRSFFLYQKWWTFELNSIKHISFLQIDWSSFMFTILNWPLPHQLISSSFLSQRWIRYYIRHLPVRARKYKQFLGNWKVYKKFPKR